MTNTEKREKMQDLNDYVNHLNYKIFQAAISDSLYPEDNSNDKDILWTTELLLKKVYELYPDELKTFKLFYE